MVTYIGHIEKTLIIRKERESRTMINVGLKNLIEFEFEEFYQILQTYINHRTPLNPTCVI